MLNNELYELIASRRDRPATETTRARFGSHSGAWDQRWTRPEYHSEPSEHLEALIDHLWPDPGLLGPFRIKAGYLLAARAEDDLALPAHREDPLADELARWSTAICARTACPSGKPAGLAVRRARRSDTDRADIDPSAAAAAARTNRPEITLWPAATRPAGSCTTEAVGRRSAVGLEFRTAADFPASTESWSLRRQSPRPREHRRHRTARHAARRRSSRTPSRAAILAAWSGWGAIPAGLRSPQRRLHRRAPTARDLLSAEQYRQAEASILNAHYTDPAVVAVIWHAMRRRRVLRRPRSRTGLRQRHIHRACPRRCRHGRCRKRRRSPPRSPRCFTPRRRSATKALKPPASPRPASPPVGNVPFGRYAMADPVHNPRRHSVHNHFICKSLALTAPGGYVAVLTSRYTMDSVKPAARRDMAEHADLDRRNPAALPGVQPRRRHRRRHRPAHIASPRTRRASPERHARMDEHRTRRSRRPPEGDQDGARQRLLRHNPHRVLGAMALGHGLNGSPNSPSPAPPATSWPSSFAPTHPSSPRRGARARPDRPQRRPHRLRDNGFRPGPEHPDSPDDDPPLYTLRYNAATRSIDCSGFSCPSTVFCCSAR